MRPLPHQHACPVCQRIHWTPGELDLIEAHHRTCLVCKESCFHEYVVKPDVWAAAGLSYHDGVLHLECLEQRLDRHLNIDDFDPTIRGNDTIFWVLSVMAKRKQK